MIFLERDMYLDISDITDDMFDYMIEAVTNTHVIVENLYPKIEAILSTPAGDRKFKQLVGKYMDRNNEKLHTSGPVYLIPFGDTDKSEYYSLFQINMKELNGWIDTVIKNLNTAGGDFLLLRNNQIFWIFYCCIRYYTIKKDEKGLNTALAIYALSVYPSVFSMNFRYGANEAVMQYTIDNLTEKYIIKQAGHIFGALFISIQHSYKFLEPYIKDGSDKEVIRFIQRIRNDQKSMIGKIREQYMKNYNKGLRVSLTKGTNADIPIDVENQNKTSTVEYVGRKVSLKLLTDGVDIKYCSMCAHIANVSVSDARFYISKIMVDKNSEKIEKFIESVLFLYLYDENKKPEDINSRHFLLWSEDLFRKTNSNNDNIKRIKTTLDEWAEETGVHAKFKREASRVNYKKAIFFYFILSIQKYNN